MAALLGDGDADLFSSPALRHCLFASQQEALTRRGGGGRRQLRGRFLCARGTSVLEMGDQW